MKKRYTFDYMKIYLWQGFSLIASCLALVIVVPRLSSVPAIYGIYSICMSVTICFTFADLGFIGASYKFASEQFAVGNLNEEIKIVGFVTFILSIAALLFMIVMLVFAINPHLLIRSLNDPGEAAIASRLLFILAIFSPVIVLQRLCQIVFGIRLEDYIYQRYSVLASLARIASVFYFFSGSKNDIVGYFLFFQLAGLTSNIFYLFIIKNRYHYDLRLLLRSLRFSSKMYSLTKRLAIGSLLTTIIFILYYELDLYAIGRLSGAEMAGFYGIGLTIMSFFRGILGVIFGPFVARFNHFMGLSDPEGLKTMLYNVIILTLPLVVFPIVCIVMLMKPLIICWVGSKYSVSITVAQFLTMSFVYNFIVQPTSILITTQERVKAMITIGLIVVFVYWTGIFFTYSSIGILAFALFKFIAFTISAAFYLMMVARFLEFKPVILLKRIVSPAILPILFLITILAYVGRFMPTEKNALNLMLVVGSGGMTFLVALSLYYASSSCFRSYINNLFIKFREARIPC